MCSVCGVRGLVERQLRRIAYGVNRLVSLQRSFSSGVRFGCIGNNLPNASFGTRGITRVVGNQMDVDMKDSLARRAG